MEKDRHFGMHGYGYFGSVALFLNDFICTCMDICYRVADIYYKVADSRKEVFAQQRNISGKNGLEKIPEIEAIESLARQRGGLKGLI